VDPRRFDPQVSPSLVREDNSPGRILFSLNSLSTWDHRIVRLRRAQTIPRSTPALRVAFDGCSRFRLASMQLSAQSVGGQKL